MPRRWTKTERELAAAGAFILAFAIVVGLVAGIGATVYILVHALGVAGGVVGPEDDDDYDVVPVVLPPATARIRRG